MEFYEVLMLTIPEITKDEASTLEFQVDKIIGTCKASMKRFDRWGKYKLAYPVKKNDYGVYFLAQFEMEKSADITPELNRLFALKFSGVVMRFLVTKLNSEKPFEYQKPPSLEDTPRKNVSSFLEEKGLLKKSNSKFAKSSEKSVKESAEKEPVAKAEKEEAKDSEAPLKTEVKA